MAFWVLDQQNVCTRKYKERATQCEVLDVIIINNNNNNENLI